jgi:hypothetical protein
MSKVLCEYNDLKNVANAIREKSNTNNEYLVSQLANAISTIPTSLGVACGLYFS